LKADSGDLDRYRNFRSVILRYFNAAGADPQGESVSGIAGNACNTARDRKPPLGKRSHFSGPWHRLRHARWLVHPRLRPRIDLADAHTRAIDHLLGNGKSLALNLEPETARTVRELLAVVQRVSGRSFKIEYGDRREG